MRRPEDSSKADQHYQQAEALRYDSCAQTLAVQHRLTHRALDILSRLLGSNDHTRACFLNLGCGSGHCAQILAARGFHWLGLDISTSMIELTRKKLATGMLTAGDVCLADFSVPLPLRANCFRAVVSISAVQWLCKAQEHVMLGFFCSLHKCLASGGVAVLQVYLGDAQDAAQLRSAAESSGFAASLVVDFPHQTAARIYYLLLQKAGKDDPLEGKACRSLNHK